ncbi:hypothetical protein MTO96_044602 [Rhipicephalus appendiculatus]
MPRRKERFGPVEARTWERCVVLRCDPGGFPDYSDFKESLERHGLIYQFSSIVKVPLSRDWVVKIKRFARATIQDLVNDGTITVKGLCCTVIETKPHKTKIEVHTMPCYLTDSDIRREFQNYGVVTRVARRKTGEDDSDYGRAIRDVHLYLKKGLTVADLPHVVSNAEENQKVPVDPGDVQVTPTVECDEEEQSVSNQETARVAEEATANEPHEAVPDEETGNASSGDLNDSSEDGKVPPTSCPLL